MEEQNYAHAQALKDASLGMEDAWGLMALEGPREMYKPAESKEVARTDFHSEEPFVYGESGPAIS